MFILHDLLVPLQEEFSNTSQGQKRKIWFAYTLLAVVVPATEERIIVALDDSINPKSGRKIFGCGHFHDHAGMGFFSIDHCKHVFN